MKKIAFYAPLKPVGHPVPSGDRLMARQLIEILRRMGHQVDIASTLRVFLRDPDDHARAHALQQQADQERQRLTLQWQEQGAPDAWFCYHPYFKSPDLIGPTLCKSFAMDYVTAEATWSARRNQGLWRTMQERVLDAVEQAAVNLCFTQRDWHGLRQGAPQSRLARLKPFIDTRRFACSERIPQPRHLVTVAMMRAGDKLHSYELLAAALQSLLHLPWTLSIIGDGPRREEVKQLFSSIPAGRIHWRGQLEAAGIAAQFARSALFVWPGCGEAYGLCYLEAQAAGLPVVACDTAGVSEVVAQGVGGLLTPEDDVQAYANAVASLLGNEDRLLELSHSAAAQVLREHSMDSALQSLGNLLHGFLPACR